MKKRKGQVSHKKDYSVVVRYSDNAIKNDLIKFIPKSKKPFVIQLGEMVDLLSKFVSQDVLAPTLMDNKVVNMIKVQRALVFTPNKDINAGETINIPFEHMMPIEYAIAEEAVGVAKISDKVVTINDKLLQQAKKRVDDRVKDFAKASYESMIRKYKEEQEKLNTEEDNQGET